MRKIMSFVLLVAMLSVQIALPAFATSTEPVMHEFLYERGGLMTTASAPSSQASLPYTGGWNSVIESTQTGKYFKGQSKYKITLDVAMNYANTSAYFNLYLVNMTTGNEYKLFGSSTEVFSYKKTVTLNIDSATKFYLKFTKTGGRSCWGSITVAKA